MNGSPNNRVLPLSVTGRAVSSGSRSARAPHSVADRSQARRQIRLRAAWRSAGAFALLAAFTLLSAFTARPVSAKLRLPDHVFYGSVRVDGSQVVSGTLSVAVEGSAEVLASFTYPEPADPDAPYVLRVPLDALDPQLIGTARVGDRLVFTLEGRAVGSTTLAGQGIAERLDLGEQPPSIGVPDIKVGVNGQEVSVAVFTIRLSQAVPFDVSVRYQTADGSATAGQDYDAASGIATIAAGQTSISVSTKANGARLDGAEQQTFYLDLSNPVKATLADNRALCVLTDLALLRGQDVAAVESASPARTASALVVTLSGASAKEVRVDYGTVDGSARAGEDYAAASGTLVFAPGQLSQVVPLSILDDPAYEGPETFLVRLSNPKNGVLSRSDYTVTVQDDEALIYEQMDRFSTTAIRSVHYTSSLAAFDAQAADDFTLSKRTTIKSVELLGIWGQAPGTAPRMRVQFLSQAPGSEPAAVPGGVVDAAASQAVTPLLLAPNSSLIGEPVRTVLTLSTPVTLEPGTYWLSVQAAMGSNAANKWFWVYQTAQNGSLFTYRNPGNAYLENCVDWGAASACPGVPGKSLSFRLVGQHVPTVDAPDPTVLLIVLLPVFALLHAVSGRRQSRSRVRALAAWGLMMGAGTAMAGAQPPAPPADAQVLATVGDRSITVEEFRRAMQRRGGGQPGQFSTLEQKQALLDELLRTAVYAQQARKAGLDQDPEIQERIERMLARKLLEVQLGDRLEKLAVTEEEVRADYRAHSARYTSPERVRAAIVQIRVPETADAKRKAEIEKRAQAALAEARKLDPTAPGFGAVAVKYSDDQATRYQRGEIGWLVAGRKDYRWEPEVTAAALALKAPGDLAPIVRARSGYYLVRLIERQPSAPVPLERVRSEIEQRLLQKKRTQLLTELYDSLRKDVAVDVRKPVLEAIEPVAPSGDAQGDQHPPALPVP